ncbi:hypothetical protein ACJIZ3_020717 [Penstemon smallii]|uniref:IBH1-like N-terminal domain-containing protein n=1 Tax=Penstemon smallii TaxID=265156 RepID=A0ABD3SK12_9LAMI
MCPHVLCFSLIGPPPTPSFFYQINGLYSLSSSSSSHSQLSSSINFSFPRNLHSSAWIFQVMKSRMQNSTALLKQEFMKKWIKGLQIFNKSNKKNMSNILDRKKAIKLTSDVAIASTRRATTHWSHTLISDLVSKDETNRNLVEQILGRKDVQKKNLVKRGRIACRKAKRVVPQSVTKVKASSLAKKLLKKRTRVLKRLVPGGKALDEISLIKETLDYIVSLRVQVDVMRHIVTAAEKLDHSKGQLCN